MQIEQKQKEMSHLSFLFFHTLREPVRAMASFSSLIRKKTSTLNDQAISQYCELLAASATHLQKIMTTTNLFFALGAQDLILHPSNLQSIAWEAYMHVLGAYAAEKATVSITPLPTLPVDRKRLAFIFQQLLSNAFQFRGDLPLAVKIQAEELQDHWKISVSDNGQGINLSEQKHLFDLFYQGQQTPISPPLTGEDPMGSGLAFVKRLIELHGGSIGIEPNPQHGTTVWFTLPKVN